MHHNNNDTVKWCKGDVLSLSGYYCCHCLLINSDQHSMGLVRMMINKQTLKSCVISRNEKESLPLTHLSYGAFFLIVLSITNSFIQYLLRAGEIWRLVV